MHFWKQHKLATVTMWSSRVRSHRLWASDKWLMMNVAWLLGYILCRIGPEVSAAINNATTPLFPFSIHSRPLTSLTHYSPKSSRVPAPQPPPCRATTTTSFQLNQRAGNREGDAATRRLIGRACKWRWRRRRRPLSGEL